MHHHYALLANFVKRSKRVRYREMLSNPRMREKFVQKLAHFADFDTEYRVDIPGSKLRADNIGQELKKRHCPTVVFAISENPGLHEQEISIADALRVVVGAGMGTVLSCIPGHLVFVETEDERYILERHDPLAKREYVRFVVGDTDDDSHAARGIFQASYRALEWDQISGADADQLKKLLKWFDGNLGRPESFGRASVPLGICWFKSESKEHVSRIWQIVRILEQNGIFVKKLRTCTPGYVVYEDDWQIVAEPFRKFRITR